MANSEALSDALTALLYADPFHSAMLMNMDVIESDKYPTAATDCWKKVFINPQFIASMPPAEGAAVIAHEVGHAVRFHGVRMKRLMEQEGALAPRIYNMAGDFRINKDLDEMGYPFQSMATRMGSMTIAEAKVFLASMGASGSGSPGSPQGGHAGGFCLDLSLADTLDTEDVYRDLMAAIPPQALKPQQPGGSASGPGEGQGEGQGGGQPGEGGEGEGDGEGENTGNNPSNSIMGGSDASLDEFENTLKEQGGTVESAEQDITTSIVAAAQAAQARGIGNLPAHIQSIVDKFNKPSVDWRSHLRRFVSAVARDDWSYRRMHRRSAPPVIQPSLYSERPGVIGVVVDTSGSVSHAELEQAMSEIASIARRVKPLEIIVLAVDTQVNNVGRFKPGQPLTEFNCKGRGGTDMTPGFEWFKDNNIKPECIICLTDGELFAWPTRKGLRGVPLLWGICNTRADAATLAKDATYGHVVQITLQD